MNESGLDQNPEAALDPKLPREIDPETLAQIDKQIKELKETQGKTESGSAAPEVNWDDFDVDPELAHLYKRGRVEDIDGKPTWVAAEHQFFIATGNYSGELKGKDKSGRYKRLDDIATAVVNGPDGIISVPEHGWRLSAIIPNGSGMGVAVFERNVKRVLPDPVLVEKKAVVADVKDKELVEMTKTADAWAAGQRGEDGNPETTPDHSDEGQVVAGEHADVGVASGSDSVSA